MPTFWDLPKDVRDIIYRHHLVYDKPVTIEMHRKAIAFTGDTYAKNRCMPPICHLSKKAEREAVPFYYGTNIFDLGDMSVWPFSQSTWPRHWNQVRKVVCTWSAVYSWGRYGVVREVFLSLSKMKKLEELSIRIDEAKMTAFMGVKREFRQQAFTVDLTAQQSLSILRFPGMTGLLALKGVKHINFIKQIDANGVETGGMIPGGALEMHILPRLKPQFQAKRQKNGSFRFLDLPPELRNHVYHLLLRVHGPIHPSKEPPTSAPRNPDKVRIYENPENTESGLSMLAVCKQMNKEGMGAFYNCNAFLFHYPVQLSAFLMDLGPQRQNMLRDITLHYYNIKMAGIELIDTTFPLLLQLKGLKKLHVVMSTNFAETSLRRGWVQKTWRISWPDITLVGTNPALIPGMRILFRLRGLEDINVRDQPLESEVERLKKDPKYPDFPADGKEAKFIQLSRAFEHFNAALADAQRGKINNKLFEIEHWQMDDVFPTIDEVEEEAENKEEENVVSSTPESDGEHTTLSIPDGRDSEEDGLGEDANDGDYKP